MKKAEIFAPDDCRFFRIRCTSEMLGISEGHAYRIIANNRLQAHHFGRVTRVSLEAIRRYVASNRAERLEPSSPPLGQGKDVGVELEPVRPPDDCVFYRVREIADLLQVTPRHVHRLIEAKALNADHFGRSTRISLASLRRYLADTLSAPKDGLR